MKRLITAEVVRTEYASGVKRIVITRIGCIVTPEARTVADGLGVAIVEDESAIVAAVAAPACKAVNGASCVLPEKPDNLEKIRAAVLAQLPKNTVSPELVDQLVKKIVAERGGIKAEPSTPVVAKSAVASYDSSKIAKGIKLVKGDSVCMGLFDGAGEDNRVGIADVVTSEDGSSIAAGFMSWEKSFFPWTLNYDEVDLVMEGELHIRCEGQTVVGKAGDVIFIPKGSSIEFGTPSKVRFLYVAYPANWSEC